MNISKWDRIVMKAWLERNDPQSRWWHPFKAALIFARYCRNIERVQQHYKKGER